MTRFNRVIGTLIVVATALLTAQQSHAQVQPLTVFFIHGLEGGTETFADMPELLEETFNTPGQAPVIRSVRLLYSTQDPKANTADFVKQIHEQIMANMPDKKAPYSLIMHSQGAIIGREYIDNCMGKGSMQLSNGSEWRGCSQQAPPNLKHFITLAGAFWGSPVANAMTNGNWLLGMFGDGLSRQDHDLAIGSKNLVEDRIDIIIDQLIHRRFFPQQTRVMAVVGDVSTNLPQFKLLEPFVGSAVGDSETDLAVEASYASPNFLFHYIVGAKDVQAETHVADHVETYYVTQPHTDMDPLLGPVADGMAAVRRGKSDNHAAFQLILRELTNSYFYNYAVQARVDADIARLINEKNHSPDWGPFKSRMRVFTSELELHLPEGYDRDFGLDGNPQKIAIYFQSLSQPGVRLSQSQLTGTPIESLVIDDSMIAKLVGFTSTDQTKSTRKHFIGFYHSGRLRLESAFIPNPLNPDLTPQVVGDVCYSVNTPGLKQTTFCTQIAPAKASFSRIDLLADIPYANGRAADGTCFVAVVPKAQNKHQGSVFATNYDVTPFKNLQENSTIEVYGLENSRYRFNDSGVWHYIEHGDVDIDRNRPCGRSS